MLLIESGALEVVPVANLNQTITLRSMELSWLDLNDNVTFESKTEVKKRPVAGRRRVRRVPGTIEGTAHLAACEPE